MSQLRSVLVATDFSVGAERALQRGAQIARDLPARLQLLHVVDAPALEALRMLSPDARTATSRLQIAAQEALEAQAARVDVPIDVELSIGGVVVEIASFAQQTDLLVVGAHGAGRPRDLLIGTTAERLLRKSRRSLLVVRGLAATPYRRVVAAVDFSADSIRALEIATRLAPDARITAVHAVELPFESRLGLAGVRDADLRDYRNEAQRQALAALAKLVGDFSNDRGRIDARAPIGRAPDAVLQVACELDADLIALGKHGMSAIEELLLGSVVVHVVAGARCDVLVARANES